MPINASEIRLGLTGKVYSGPIGTAFPATVVAVPAVTWIEHGYLTEDAISIGLSIDTQSIMGWQSLTALRNVKLSSEFAVTFALMQRNAANLKLAFGGGTIAASGTSTLYSPPALTAVDERAFMFEVTDGAITDRWLLERGLASLSGDVAFKKDEATAYELTVVALTGATGTWRLMTNDPSVIVDV